MKIYSVCNTQRKRDDGNMPVYIVIYRSGIPRLRINTGLLCKYAPVDCLFPHKEQNSKAKSKYLLDMITKVEVIVLENSLLPNAELKKKIMSQVFRDDRYDAMTIVECFDLFIKERKSDNEGGASVYTSSKNSVAVYDPLATVCVDKNWAVAYDEYLAKNVKPNTKATRIANIKTVFSWAVKKGFTNTNPFSDIRVNRTTTKKRNLSIESLRAIRDAELTGKAEQYRDIFMLMFYLIGINAKDLLTAKKSQVMDGRLEYTRAKTGKQYSIKIEPEAQAIIDKYPGKENLLSVCEGGDHLKYTTNMDHMLGKIKKGLTSYYSRHSWASFAAQLEVPIETISNALGHSHGAKMTLVYVNYNYNKVDEANRMVIDFVNG